MGATLVTQVLAYWTDVSEPAFRILVRMAVTALDTPSNGKPACVYHGGRELLAMTFRSQKGSERTRNRAVAKAISELTQAGAIEHLATGWAGQRAVYKLTLDRAESARMGGPTDHPEGGPTDHPMGGLSATKRVVPQTTPRNHEEPIQELEEEEVVELRTTSHPPRATQKPSEPSPSGTVVELFRTRKWSTRGADAVAAATAARAQRVAAYQAQLAAEKETS